MAVLEISRIQVRRGQENQTGVPTLAGGEFGWAADTEHLYIGLRREDGGARDASIRILTENDLFTAITSLDLGYTYRKDTNPAITAPTFDGIAFERSVNKKLDDFVSVKDFGVLGVGGDDVDSALIQVAVDNLFLDPLKTANDYGNTSAKILYFPAGIYNIDTPIFIPRYTTIIGEGIGKTIINLISNDSHAFQTIDSDPDNAYPDRATFDHNGIGTGITQPNNIHIEGLTIKYDPTTDVTNCLELIALDCAEHSIIKNVRFAGNHEVGDATTTTYGAILIRGYSGELASSNNVLIDSCEFDGLHYDIGSRHDISNLTIQNNIFNNSKSGISFNYPGKDPDATIGPKYAKIVNNNFKSIEGPAIYVGENPSSVIGTNHISMNNRFYDCGNLGNGRASSTGNPVITFVSDTNISKNDWFDRQEYNQVNIGSSQKYLPLIQGKAFIEQSGVKSSTLTTGIITRILRFPLIAAPQQLIVYYNLWSSSLSENVYRTGKLIWSLSKATTPESNNVLDEYTSLEGTLDAVIQWSTYVNSASTYYELRIQQDTTYDMKLSYHYNLSLY